MINDRPELRTKRMPIWFWFASANLLIILLLIGWIVSRPRPEAANANPESPVENRGLPVNSPKLEIRESLPDRPRTAEEIVEKAKSGVVLISTFDSAGSKIGFGSGFVIDSSGLIATNFHWPALKVIQKRSTLTYRL